MKSTILLALLLIVGLWFLSAHPEITPEAVWSELSR
jgi:hypothetical protein